MPPLEIQLAKFTRNLGFSSNAQNTDRSTTIELGPVLYFFTDCLFNDTWLLKSGGTFGGLLVPPPGFSGPLRLIIVKVLVEIRFALIRNLFIFVGVVRNVADFLFDSFVEIWSL